MKLLIVAGARPNFMKVAPIIKAVTASGSRISYSLVHTGQHYDAKMSDIFFQELGIPEPHFNLGVGSGSHAVQTANLMLKFEPVCLQEQPDWLVVVGDVNSTMACTLVASKLGTKVAHVEGGLRSFDRTMPEEVNRLVTDALADLLLTPSEDADHNLLREGVAPEKIRLVGNIMIDALVDNLAAARRSDVLSRLNVKKESYVYVTLHRPSNVDSVESLSALLAALSNLAREIPIIFPMHPRTRRMIGETGMHLDSHPDFQIVEPLGYHDSLALTENARLVLTDSGGLQEESTYFRTPCLTLRPNTERPVTVTIGSNKLTSLARLPADLKEVLSGPAKRGTIPPLWDGKTAGRILSELSSVSATAR